MEIGMELEGDKVPKMNSKFSLAVFQTSNAPGDDDGNLPLTCLYCLQLRNQLVQHYHRDTYGPLHCMGDTCTPAAASVIAELYLNYQSRLPRQIWIKSHW